MKEPKTDYMKQLQKAITDANERRGKKIGVGIEQGLCQVAEYDSEYNETILGKGLKGHEVIDFINSI